MWDCERIGAPTMTRTWDPQIRNLVLYPTELPGLDMGVILNDFVALGNRAARDSAPLVASRLGSGHSPHGSRRSRLAEQCSASPSATSTHPTELPGLDMGVILNDFVALGNRAARDSAPLVASRLGSGHSPHGSRRSRLAEQCSASPAATSTHPTELPGLSKVQFSTTSLHWAIAPRRKRDRRRCLRRRQSHSGQSSS